MLRSIIRYPASSRRDLLSDP